VARGAKDCPFCGCRAKVWTRISHDMRVDKDVERTTVLCTACGCRTQAFRRPEDAIEAWNRRTGGVRAAGRRPWWRRILGRILGV